MKYTKRILSLLAVALVLAAFLTGLHRFEADRAAQGRQQLEDTLRKTAAACYAAEGFYPPDVDYMCQHYGIQYDESQYAVMYDLFASNLMPDITVLEVIP